MFKPDRCTLCGDCLVECQWMDVGRTQAVEWFKEMMEGKRTPVLERCITCYACNETCPEQANPFDLIADLQEKHGIPVARATVEQSEARFSFSGELQNLPQAERVLSTCVFGKSDPHLIQGELYALPQVAGKPFFCWILFSHMCAPSIQQKHATEFVARLSATGAREVVCFHDDCYAMLAKLAPEYGIRVPFRPVHLSEHLVRRLEADRKRVRPLNLEIAYQRPCASRHTPEKEHFLDELFGLVGARRVERKYDRKGALCCGGVKLLLGNGDPTPDQERNILDAKQAGARAMVCLCPMCIRSLGKVAAGHGMPLIFLGDLARMALGEIPLPF